MATKNRTSSMSPKTQEAADRSHTESAATGAKEVLPFSRREQIPANGNTITNHNNRGNTHLRGKNLAYATRKVKK